ncbi:MAG: hypothetical protein LBI43_00490 [Streptococcaceae bacterium]|jgi:hypothetical protein|nr:hypothetical protein [Streptococcaceae bacterium]
MSTNKIMALIGNILYTLATVFGLIIGGVSLGTLSAFSNPSLYAGSDADSQAAQQVASVSQSMTGVFVAVFVIAALIAIVTLVFTWIAFGKIDGPKAKGWKIFLLVIGILSVFDMFAGVFFILAFALKSEPKTAVEVTPAGDDGWSELPTSNSESGTL